MRKKPRKRGRPILPPSQKRKKSTICLRPKDWDQLDEIGPSRSKAVETMLAEREEMKPLEEPK